MFIATTLLVLKAVGVGCVGYSTFEFLKGYKELQEKNDELAIGEVEPMVKKPRLRR